jgi:uncharacterized protein (TIGR02246 family)
MRWFRAVPVLIVVLGFLGVGAAAKAADNEKMIAGAKALDAAFVDAFNKGDVEAMTSLYWNSPDVVTFPPGELVARGIDAIKASYAQMAATMKGAKLEMTEVHYIPAGDVVIGWGLWKLTMPGPEGKSVEVAGRYTDVKAERDGKWVYLIDHASMPMPSSGE